MKAWKENQFQLAVLRSPAASYQELLKSQKELFQCQIDQLQHIVLTQSKLTSVNPLSQEMAAGALSIKIGKRPRDLLNPKAIKYMQSVFSVKDAITKKESREISARFGVTITQVRDFFNSQRSRVRKFIRLSSEKDVKSNACKEVQDGVPSRSDSDIPIAPVPLNFVAPTSMEGETSCSTQDAILAGVDDSDKLFLENIFSLMRKEETFSGQVKLMEWILQIQNSSALYWFLTKGGVMILATWLSQAATEEQTSVLYVILKVLCHLPLHKALPAHMSAILQSVNRLRFYRTSDVSNRARILLARWSKIFARSQAMKKPNSLKSASDAQDDLLLKQSIGEIMGNESGQSIVDVSETLTPYESSENYRRLESSKLLTATTDDSNRKLMRGVSSSQIRERRKVLLVEQPGQRTAGRSLPVARSVSATKGRPLSADDIQKAKLRAQFMQSKYGKTSTSPDESRNKYSSSQASVLLSGSKGHVRPKIEEHKILDKSPLKVSNQLEAPPYSKMILDPEEEPTWKKCKRVQILWQTPPEMRISDDWSVRTGENSKEIEVQKNRIRREREIIYKTVLEIPSDPKEPWDREMDYDDSLTLEIPTEQLPDVDGVETVVSPREKEVVDFSPGSNVASSSSQNGIANMPEPDLELLAVLLKNPELVLALTSGQASGLSSDDTVKLLDIIKANGVSSLSNLTGLGRKAEEEKVEVSLPSPTPSSDPVTCGWRPDFAKNPFSRQNAAYDMPGVAVPGPSQEKLPASRLVQPQVMLASHRPPFNPQRAQQAIHQALLLQKVTALPENPPPLTVPSLHPNAPISSQNMRRSSSDVVLDMNNFSASSLPSTSLSAAASALMEVETLGNIQPATVSIAVNTPRRQPHSFTVPPLLPTLAPSQAPLVPDHPHLSTHSWRTRNSLASNPLSQANHQNNHNAYVTQGPFRPTLRPSPRWDRNEVGEPGFESWSPEHSTMGSPQYRPGWNRRDPQMNLEPNYRPERPRPENPTGYHNYGRDGNRSWRDRRR